MTRRNTCAHNKRLSMRREHRCELGEWSGCEPGDEEDICRECESYLPMARLSIPDADRTIRKGD